MASRHGPSLYRCCNASTSTTMGSVCTEVATAFPLMRKIPAKSQLSIVVTAISTMLAKVPLTLPPENRFFAASVTLKVTSTRESLSTAD